MATDKGGSNDAASIDAKKDLNGSSTEWGATSAAENQPQQPQSQLSALLSQNGKNNGSIGDAIVIPYIFIEYFRSAKHTFMMIFRVQHCLSQRQSLPVPSW